tara:strand:- start:1935 stop:2147 length:213 start_codon:yes stop_codon:yes gene_type:complete
VENGKKGAAMVEKLTALLESIKKLILAFKKQGNNNSVEMGLLEAQLHNLTVEKEAALNLIAEIEDEIKKL